jgi:hypothetical protein
MTASSIFHAAERHWLVRAALIPFTYVAGVLTCVALASTMVPAGRSDWFAMTFLVIAALAPIHAALGNRYRSPLGWLLVWLMLVGLCSLAYVVIGLEFMVLE